MKKSESGTVEFGKVRSVLWPIHNFELKKFLPMSIMMIAILFIYTLCRDLKDTLVQTCAVGGGSAMLSALKTWFVLPMSFLFMAVFMKLSNKFSSKSMFYGILTFFLAFYGLFGFVLFPNIKHLHAPIETVRALQAKFPYMHWVVPCLTNWTITLAYVMAELWGTAVIGLLFWQFANEITKTTEAKRFYSLFGMIGNLGLIGSGSLVEMLAAQAAKKKDMDQMVVFGQSLRCQMGFVLLFGFIIIGIYAWMQKYVLTDPRLYTKGTGVKKSKKPKMGLFESIKYVITSPYVLLIATLVFSYGMSTVLIEQVWKSQVKIAYPDSAGYNGFMGRYSKLTGMLTIILMILGMNILKNCKWRTTALITPVFTGVAAVVMLLLMLFRQKNGIDANIFGMSALAACTWVGAFQIGAMKGIKYSMFDSTKNMAYLPLDSDEKTKSQAAVEVVGSRLGKSGASTLIVILTNLIWSGSDITSGYNMQIVMGSSVLVVLLWVVAVIKMNPKVVEKLEEKAREEKAEIEAGAASA